jgi:hypothetical protein
VASDEIERRDPHTRGNTDGYQNKGVARQESGGQAGRAIRKNMKIKGEEEWVVGSE